MHALRHRQYAAPIALVSAFFLLPAVAVAQAPVAKVNGVAIPQAKLDAILKASIDHERTPQEIIADLTPQWPDHDVAHETARMLRLVRISEWKRRQAAPGPKLSRRAFGRERRYPISSGWRD